MRLGGDGGEAETVVIGPEEGRGARDGVASGTVAVEAEVEHRRDGDHRPRQRQGRERGEPEDIGDGNELQALPPLLAAGREDFLEVVLARVMELTVALPASVAAFPLSAGAADEKRPRVALSPGP